MINKHLFTECYAAMRNLWETCESAVTMETFETLFQRFSAFKLYKQALVIWSKNLVLNSHAVRVSDKPAHC